MRTSFKCRHQKLLFVLGPPPQIHLSGVILDNVTYCSKAASWFGIAVFFALPYFVEDAGVGIIDANWKPHTYLYRLAFLVSMPALFFIATGFGGVAGNGLTHTGTFAELMAQAGGNLQNNNVGDAVILKDGFVALNLTKSIIKTLSVPNEASTRPLERGGQIFQRETQYNSIFE